MIPKSFFVLFLIQIPSPLLSSSTLSLSFLHQHPQGTEVCTSFKLTCLYTHFMAYIISLVSKQVSIVQNFKMLDFLLLFVYKFSNIFIGMYCRCIMISTIMHKYNDTIISCLFLLYFYITCLPLIQVEHNLTTQIGMLG